MNEWLIFALGSAFFAALTAIFGKIGVHDINSNLATFIRTIVILVMTAGIVSLRHEWQPLDKFPRFGVLMLALSGVATGLSWLCYWRAMQLAPASRVAPIDKLSIVLVILFSLAFLGETLTWKVALGGSLIMAGTMLLAI